VPSLLRVSPVVRYGLPIGLFLAVAGCASTPRARPSWTEDFRFRDPVEGLDSVALTRTERKKLDAGLAALRSGDLGEATAAFRSGARGANGAPFRLGLVYADLASGRYPAAREALEVMLAASPEWIAALEARADLEAVEGHGREALEAYRALGRLVPDDARARERCAGMEALLRDKALADAEGALVREDAEAARRAAAALLELDPSSPLGFRYLARAAEAAGRNEDAFAAAERAHGLDAADVPTTRMLAELAMKTGRYGEAVSLFSVLAVSDESFKGKAEEARREFQIHNLPKVAQQAALSPRIGRAQFSALMWLLVPEVRDAPSGAASEVAVDALDRPERTALVKAIQLGFFSVSHETHTVGADVPVTRVELAALLKRLASVVRRRGEGCLWAEKVTPATLGECGILQDVTSRYVTGKEALLAIEAAARAAREGES
jgi:tetratricopeptide (TPR) repeat protein